MKRYIILPLLCLAAASMTACNDWLREEAPGTTKLSDFFTGGETCRQAVIASYVPLMWEFNGTYFSEWFIGDIMSDDALKGGENTGDMANAYDLENFKTITTNDLLLQYYRAQYQGVSRCNLAIQNIPAVLPDDTMDERLKERYLGEAYFLRAYYYFRLVRAFGDVPMPMVPLTSSSEWQQPRSPKSAVYALILSDLTNAEAMLWKKSEVPAEEAGIATKGAAQAMLMKVNLYLKDYDEAHKWGTALMKQADEEGEYTLCNNYNDNFTLEGENGPESIFEIQYMEDPTSDFGEGFGFTRGTFTPILTRSRSSKLGAGWGFNKPTQNLYDEFEAGDPRREWTIINPSDELIETPEQEIYLGCRYLNRKYAIMTSDDNSTWYALSHQSRGPINNKQIRFADALLMYAEACLGSGLDLDKGKEALNRVRGRVGLGEVELNETTLRHERRVELAMEGHRWFDLCRWGIAKQTMDAYKATETPEARAEMSEFVQGKHELLPIPAEEVRMGNLTQNPGY